MKETDQAAASGITRCTNTSPPVETARSRRADGKRKGDMVTAAPPYGPPGRAFGRPTTPPDNLARQQFKAWG
jgi:hypothetical protein